MVDSLPCLMEIVLPTGEELGGGRYGPFHANIVLYFRTKISWTYWETSGQKCFWCFWTEAIALGRVLLQMLQLCDCVLAAASANCIWTYCCNGSLSLKRTLLRIKEIGVWGREKGIKQYASHVNFMHQKRASLLQSSGTFMYFRCGHQSWTSSLHEAGCAEHVERSIVDLSLPSFLPVKGMIALWGRWLLSRLGGTHTW